MWKGKSNKVRVADETVDSLFGEAVARHVGGRPNLELVK
jgi:hypothetical protein